MPNPDYRIRLPGALDRLTDNNLWELLEPLSPRGAIGLPQEMSRFLDFTPGQMVVFAVVVTQREIDKGGLEGYFQSRAGMYWQYAVGGYRRIGSPERAEALERAAAFCPGERVPVTLESRLTVLATTPKEQRENLWTPLEDLLFGEHEVRPLLLRYVREHSDEFFLD